MALFEVFGEGLRGMLGLFSAILRYSTLFSWYITVFYYAIARYFSARLRNFTLFSLIFDSMIVYLKKHYKALKGL